VVEVQILIVHIQQVKEMEYQEDLVVEVVTEHQILLKQMVVQEMYHPLVLLKEIMVVQVHQLIIQDQVEEVVQQP
jgi:hypothetical protein